MVLITRHRYTSPELDEIFDLCTFNDYTQHEVFRAQVLNALQNTPEEVLILKALDGNRLIGFVIAEATPWSSVHLAQAWVYSGIAWSVIDALFDRVILWAVAIGRTNITIESSRNSQALERRFQFQTISTNLRYDLTPDTLKNIVSQIKDSRHGKSLSDAKTELSQHVVGGATATPRTTSGVDPGSTHRVPTGAQSSIERVVSQHDAPGSGDV